MRNSVWAIDSVWAAVFALFLGAIAAFVWFFLEGIHSDTRLVLFAVLMVGAYILAVQASILKLLERLKTVG